ncbi:aldo/keto reductase [Rhizobium sp. RM]|uniref:aldo/keto reductase n=1 Tax=Rhizobium sp. RM TaxID=2748079 RepID=UPI0033655636
MRAAGLAALDTVSAAHGVRSAEVAVALMAQQGVIAPITSATKVAHVESFSRAVSPELTPREFTQLKAAGTS